MPKIKVVESSSSELKHGTVVTYYSVGSWSMELFNDEFDSNISDAKDTIKSFKAWKKFLKKEKRKLRRSQKRI